MSRAVMKNYRVSAKFAVISAALLSGYAAQAQTTVSTASTTPLATSSAGDITVNTGYGITVGGITAITVDSNNSVNNAGTITVNDSSLTNGILVTGGTSGTLAINNTGTINVTDSTLATALPLSLGYNRFGIQVNSAAPFSGTITNASGASIIIRGINSAGIYLNTGGLNGGIVNAGAIGITGDNSFGILTNVNAPINGYISVTNAITSLGQQSGGIQLNGTVSGQLYLDSIVRATAYFSDGVVVTTRPTSLAGFSPNYNLIGGPTVNVLNNIAGAGYATGGIFVDTAGDLQSLGTAPALQIAPAAGSSLEIGAGTGSYGLTIAGIVESSGLYDNMTSSALQVGGTGGTAKIDGGITISGTVSSIGYAASATGISLLSGASVPTIVNTGTIVSTVNLGYSGLSTAGTTATAILDNGGALTSIANKGVISATNANTGGSAIAMDLSGDTVPVTVTQSASGTATPSSITGDIRFGSAGATLNLGSGDLIGGVSFGSATSNSLNITNGAILSGPLTEASGGTIAVSVSNGRLASTSLTNVNLSSLNVASAGELDFAVNTATGQSGSYNVTGTGVGAYIVSSGAKIGLDVGTRITGPETFTVIQTANSGALASQPAFQIGNVPYFYTANIVTNPSAGTISLALNNRTFAQAGVGGSASAYNGVFAASYNDTGIRDAFNGAGTQQSFKRLYQQMLPSYSGGLFESLSQGMGAVARAEAGNPVVQNGNRGGGWAQQIGFGEEDSGGSAPGYHGGGIGFAFGWETPASPISTWGISVSYMRGAVSDFNAGPSNQEVGTVYSAGLYWRETDGALHTDASINAGVAEMNSKRNFAGTDLLGNSVSRAASAAWDGGLAQAHVGISYEQPIGDDLYIKPLLSGDYFVLYEGSRNERNGGTGFDLNIASDSGKQGSVVGGIALGTQFGSDFFLWKPEIMVGYKEVFGGADNISAQFAGGSSFSLSPTSQQGGAVAHVGVHGGNKYSDFAFEAGGEDRGEYHNFDGRIVARFKF